MFLCNLFEKKGIDELKVSKAIKKAAKVTASKGGDQQPDALRASLQAFLGRWEALHAL